MAKVGFLNGVMNCQGVLPLGDRTENIGSTTNAFDNLFIDGISWDDGATYLDDYEQGTFNPALTFGGAAVGITYGSVWGRYTKIGNMVIFAANIYLTNKGSSTGSAVMTGLPFTCSAEGQPVPLISGGITGTTVFQSNVNSGATTVGLQQCNAATGGVSGLNDTNFSNTSAFYTQGPYFTT